MKILKGRNLESFVKAHQYNLYKQLIDYLAFKKELPSLDYSNADKVILKKHVFNFGTMDSGFSANIIEICLMSIEKVLKRKSAIPASDVDSFLSKIILDIKGKVLSAEANFCISIIYTPPELNLVKE